MSTETRPETGWIRTFTGGRFWPLDPRPEDVDIRDIAHALSQTCRYGRMASEFYSVAQHSVIVSLHVPHYDALWGLLHDAEEAYSPFGDIPRPVKREMPARELGALLDINVRIQQAVCTRYGLPAIEPATVKHADNCIILDEKPVVMPRGGSLACADGTERLGVEIEPWAPKQAEKLFLRRFYELARPRALGGVQ